MREDFRDLRVWQRAMDLVMVVYQLTQRLPPHERFDLTRQLRRAVISVPLNIAEGNGRAHLGEYIHHIYFARGSLMEVLSVLEIARRLGYLSDSDLGPSAELVDHIGRMLTRFAQRLEARRGRAPSAEGRAPC